MCNNSCMQNHNLDTAPGRLSSVAQALRVLDVLRDEEPLGVTEIARRVGVAPSTAHRLLATLAEAHYVRQPRPSGKYYVGHMLHGSAEIAAIEHCVQIALPHMEWLRDVSGETIHLVHLQQRQVRFVGAVESLQPMRVTNRAGRLLPANATAAGKVLLALLPAEEVASLLGDDLAAPTPRTISDLAALAAELDRVRAAGFGHQYSEVEIGVAALAVPLHRPAGDVLCALTLTGPEARFDRGGPPGAHVREAEMLGHLRAAAERIEADLQF